LTQSGDFEEIIDSAMAVDDTNSAFTIVFSESGLLNTYDLVSGDVLASVPLQIYPSGLEYDTDGNLYGWSVDQSIYSLDPTTGAFTDLWSSFWCGTGSGYVDNLALDIDSQIAYSIMNCPNTTLFTLNLDGSGQLTTTISSQLEAVYGIHLFTS